MSCSVQNITIEPVDVRWEIEEQWDVTTVADVSSSLQSKSFKFHAPSGVKKYVWLNVAGGGVDPAHAGYTGHAVAIGANASASAVASAIQAVVNVISGFNASVDGDEVTITNTVVGETPDMVDVNTGFTLSQCQDGGQVDLGFLDGDVEVKIENTTTEITAHQTGTQALTELVQGDTIEVSLTMKESALEKYKAIVSATGGVYTPPGGTELFGRGSQQVGVNIITFAKRLILHPVKQGVSDYSKDLCVWKAFPMPDTITYSGENPRVLAVVFKGYKDEGKTGDETKINKWSIGDWSQLTPA